MIEVIDLLPNKPSEIIAVALADLEQVEHDPDYEVTMGQWHKPITKDSCFWLGKPKCQVCLAGATMAITMKCLKSVKVFPGDLGTKICDKLHFIDRCRHEEKIGSMLAEYFLKHFYEVENNPKIHQLLPPEVNYGLAPLEFKRRMGRVVEQFQALGL